MVAACANLIFCSMGMLLGGKSPDGICLFVRSSCLGVGEGLCSRALLIETARHESVKSNSPD